MFLAPLSGRGEGRLPYDDYTTCSSTDELLVPNASLFCFLQSPCAQAGLCYGRESTQLAARPSTNHTTSGAITLRLSHVGQSALDRDAHNRFGPHLGAERGSELGECH